MSAAVMAQGVEERLNPGSLVIVQEKPAESVRQRVDAHSLVPVFVAGFIALAISSAVIGSILLWLALRDSGVLAP